MHEACIVNSIDIEGDTITSDFSGTKLTDAGGSE